VLGCRARENKKVNCDLKEKASPPPWEDVCRSENTATMSHPPLLLVNAKLSIYLHHGSKYGLNKTIHLSDAARPH
jgi:hypothetical protein